MTKIFIRAVIIGVTLAPSAAYAVDNFGEYGAVRQNATNLKQKITIIGLYGASCTAVAKSGQAAMDQVINKPSKKPLTSLVAGCTFVAGWYVGNLMKKAVKHSLR